MSARCALFAATLLGLAGCAQQPIAEHEAAQVAEPGQQQPPAQSRAGDAAIFAMAQLGSPYKYGGTSPAGFDCSGLVRYSYGLVGVTLPRDTREQRKVTRLLEPDEEYVAGDLLFFNFGSRGALHVGVWVGNGEFVHAPSSGGKVRIERFDAPHWQKRFIEARRVESAT
jgi:cell wall-associated NlpC family hydrolase